MLAKAAAAFFVATLSLASVPNVIAQENPSAAIVPLRDISMGASDAPVVVEEYASMTCVHCAAFSTDVFPEFKEKYIDTGKVRYVLKPFPLDAIASAAFVLARCDIDGNEEAFYTRVEHLFATQPEWAFVDNPRAGLIDVLDEFGFDDEKLQTCLTNQEAMAWIVETKAYGTETVKLRATPTFVVNGETQLVGNQTIDALSQAIDPLL